MLIIVDFFEYDGILACVFGITRSVTTTRIKDDFRHLVDFQVSFEIAHVLSLLYQEYAVIDAFKLIDGEIAEEETTLHPAVKLRLSFFTTKRCHTC